MEHIINNENQQKLLEAITILNIVISKENISNYEDQALEAIREVEDAVIVK